MLSVDPELRVDAGGELTLVPSKRGMHENRPEIRFSDFGSRRIYEEVVNAATHAVAQRRRTWGSSVGVSRALRRASVACWTPRSSATRRPKRNGQCSRSRKPWRSLVVVLETHGRRAPNRAAVRPPPAEIVGRTQRCRWKTWRWTNMCSTPTFDVAMRPHRRSSSPATAAVTNGVPCGAPWSHARPGSNGSRNGCRFLLL